MLSLPDRCMTRLDRRGTPAESCVVVILLQIYGVARLTGNLPNSKTRNIDGMFDFREV